MAWSRSRISVSRVSQRRAIVTSARFAPPVGVSGSPGRNRAASFTLRAGREPAQLRADLFGGRVTHAVQLIRSRSAGFDRAGTSETQLTERLDRTVTRFRERSGVTREHRSSCHLRVETIRLPAPAAPMAVGLIHLDDVQSTRTQVAAQARAPRPGAFDTQREDFTEAGHPAREVAIAASGGRERFGVELAAEFVEDDHDMKILVGIDSGDDAHVVVCDR